MKMKYLYINILISLLLLITNSSCQSSKVKIAFDERESIDAHMDRFLKGYSTVSMFVIIEEELLDEDIKIDGLIFQKRIRICKENIKNTKKPVFVDVRFSVIEISVGEQKLIFGDTSVSNDYLYLVLSKDGNKLKANFTNTYKLDFEKLIENEYKYL